MSQTDAPVATEPETTTDENGMKVRFMCPCLGPLEKKLKEKKGESAYLSLCEYADFGKNGDRMTRVRGLDPLKFSYEKQVEVTDPKKPDGKPKIRKRWATGHMSVNFCCMCGAAIK